jgi:diguanylate cyclase
VRAELERVSEFGPFDLIAEWAHGHYTVAESAAALRTCREGLAVAEAAGDERTTRYLRYVACLVHENDAQWSLLRRHTEDLLDRLDAAAGPFWRAKVLALNSHALLQQGSTVAALDALAEAYGLVVDRPGSSYNRGSACQAVSGPLRPLLLFGPAIELLSRSVRILDGHPSAVYGHLERALVHGTWGLFLELLGRDDEAEGQHVACAEHAVAGDVLAGRADDAPSRLHAAALLQFAYQRLGSAGVDPRPLAEHARHGSVRDALLSRLALASLAAQAGDDEGAVAGTRRLRQSAQRLGEPVPGWVATAWLARAQEARLGRTEATTRWREVAVGALERLWLDRAGRFEHLVARYRVAELSARVARDDGRLWEDALTGVGNRRMLDALMADPEAAARPAAFVDVDAFKAVNDRYGHDVGDAVLCRVAALLRGQCRAGDVVTRFGGDEFVVLLAGSADAATFAERVRAAVAAVRWETVTPGLGVSVSIGTSVAGPGSVLRADEALLAARGRRPGRGRRLLVPPETVVDVR